MPKIKAAMLYGPYDIRIEEVDAPEIKPNEVLVRIRAVGICGSDVLFYKNGRIGKFVVEEPLAMGHESAGEIIAVGTEVSDRHVGQRVTIEPGFPCRLCEYCKSGRYNLCPRVVFLSCPPYTGTFQEQVAVPADFTYVLPDNMSFEEGALIEPLAVGVHATLRAGVKVADSIGVLGVGPVGLLVLQAAKASGATRIIAVDAHSNRLDMARHLGATDIINFRETNPVAAVNELTNGEGLDVVFEVAGRPESLRNAITMAKPGGVIAMVGNLPVVSTEIPVMEILEKELDIKGVFRYANAYPSAIELVSRGVVDLASLVTHRFPLSQLDDALRFSDEHQDKTIKVIVEV
jgi:L-iditol 2-dehydrogenase